MMEKLEVPGWASRVVSRIERRCNGITYSVVLEPRSPGLTPDGVIGQQLSFTVWEKEVLFGTTETRHAGCHAFQEVSKEQDAIAERYAEVV